MPSTRSTPEPESSPSLQVLGEPITCSAGCGASLGSSTLPGPNGAITLTAWSNSPQLGTDYDCDPHACAGSSPITAGNGHLAYGCPWQCVELVNRYVQGTWGGPKIAANAGAGFCQYAASSSLPQYYVYGSYGASAAGHAPKAGDVLVWSGHVAIATNSMAPGVAGTIGIVEENATCTGHDSVPWSGSMFGAKYGLSALCWVHVQANTGGPSCPSGSAWHGAGDYCADEPGMANTAQNTLYSCSAAGGAASVVQACANGCQDMPATENDQCFVPTPTPAPSGSAGPSPTPDVVGSTLAPAVIDVPSAPEPGASHGAGGGCDVGDLGGVGSGAPIAALMLLGIAALRRRHWLK